MKKGFALLLSLIVTSILLVVGLGVSGVAFREIQLSGFGSQSEIAFYAAETGLECGLYWDKVAPWSGGVTAATSTFVDTTSGIKNSGVITSGCTNQDINFDTINCPPPSGSCSPDTVGFGILIDVANPKGPCANIEVNKDFSLYGPRDDKRAVTYITSTGYNTCDDSDPRRVGRVLELELNLAAP